MKEKIIKMEKEIEKLKQENKDKEDAIIELSQFYYVSLLTNFNILQYYKNKDGNNSSNENYDKKEDI